MYPRLLIALLFFSVQCLCLQFLILLIPCKFVEMFNFDLNDSHYDLREELGVYDCKYVEVEELSKALNKVHDLVVIQLNIRGLLNKQDQLKRLTTDTEADIVLLCETWLNKTKESHVDISTHKLTTNNRPDRIGGGVGILVNSNLRSRPRPDLQINTEILEHV